MAGLVALGVVRVGGVGHVGRDARRRGDRPVPVLAVAAEPDDDPLQHGRQQRARRAPVASSLPTSSWSNRHDHAHRRRLGRRPAPRPRPQARAQVVDPAALLSSSPSRPSTAPGVRSWAITSQSTTSSGVDPELLGQEPAERRRGRLADRPTAGARCCCGLSSSPVVVDLAVEVDGELRDAQQRAVDAAAAARPARRRTAPPPGRTGRGRGRATSSAARRRRPRPAAAGSRPGRCRAAA